MPYCPNCNFEYLPGRTRCPDCGAALLEGAPPPEHPWLPAPDTEPTLLRRVPDPTEAEITKAALAEAGIPALLRKHGPLTGELTTIADGATHDYALIFVPKNRLQEAQRLLAAIQSGPIQWPDGMEPDEEDPEDDQ